MKMVCSECGETVYSARYINHICTCTSCDNMIYYEAGEPSYFLCPICGKADSPKNWLGGLPREHCFSCSFWLEIIEKYNNGEKVVADGHVYKIGNEGAGRGFRGYGGRRFKIKMIEDGSIIETTNLWHNGEVPERFKDQLPDNAVFV